MSPNGRRAWRKWLKRRRRYFCRMARLLDCVKKSGKSPYRGTVKRRARKAANGVGPKAQMLKPFTARSLVGMTMGARKRLYRYIVDALPTEGDVFLICAEDEGVPIGWFLAQRLRPCPGCEECRGYDDGIGVLHCDGSGVMPARKSK